MKYASVVVVLKERLQDIRDIRNNAGNVTYFMHNKYMLGVEENNNGGADIRMAEHVVGEKDIASTYIKNITDATLASLFSRLGV